MFFKSFVVVVVVGGVVGVEEDMIILWGKEYLGLCVCARESEIIKSIRDFVIMR